MEQNTLHRQLTNPTEELRGFVKQTIVDPGATGTAELDRITRYHLYWKFYDGYHYRDYNDSMLAFNYTKAFIDKVNIFLLGKDAFTLTIKNYYNDVVEDKVSVAGEELMLYHWRKNNKAITAYKMLQMGGVTGDLFVAVQWSERLGACQIVPLDSRHCFPEFGGDGDINEMTKMVLRQPLEGNAEGYKVKVSEWTAQKVTTWYQMDTSKDGKKYKDQSVDNPLGFVPIVHIQNKPYAAGYYGKSDASDIIKLNKVYNELNQELKSIIDYYATPTTVITGASAKTLKRGMGNIWSGLPAEANVFNLGLDVDLSAATTFKDGLKTAMHELSDVPENALGKIQAISNTSAAALLLTYQPLIQQADMKWLTYGNGIAQINSIMFKIHLAKDASNERIKKLPATFGDEYLADPVFAYGFPQDKMNDLQMAATELGLKIGSRREIMERLGKNNVQELLKEIDGDTVNAVIAAPVPGTETAPEAPKGEEPGIKLEDEAA